jgi:F0F1-type ATP synthase membrane subunit a
VVILCRTFIRTYRGLRGYLVFDLRGRVGEILGAHHLKYFAYIYVLFLLILLANLFGVVPYTFTVTGHFVVTLALSSISFIGLNILGFALSEAIALFGLMMVFCFVV